MIQQETLSCESDEALDRISSLPDPITDQILGMMPLKDAVRTSILSQNWRFKWSKLSKVKFDSHSLALSSQPIIESRVVSIIDQVLILHNGPITKFKLSHKDLTGVSDIDRWLVYLSRRSVRTFALKIWKGKKYKVPTSLFLWTSLVHLKLRNCMIRVPPSFRGFTSLKSLFLGSVTIAQDVLERLISSCQLLDWIKFSNLDRISSLKICAPHLKFFAADSKLVEIRFENTSELTVVHIRSPLKVKPEASLSGGRSRRLLRVLLPLLSISRLELRNCSLQYLDTMHVKCLHLDYISISVNLCDYGEREAAIRLLQCAPNLEELKIQSEEGTGDISGDIWPNISFELSLLRTVEIDDICGGQPELGFIEAILSKSPELEKMTITPATGKWTCDLTKELLSFCRASPKAAIILED